MSKELFKKYFIEQNGLWFERLKEVQEKGFHSASSIARLIFSCETENGIDQHAAEDLKAVSAFLATQADELAAMRAAIEQAEKLVYLWRKEGEKRHDAQGPSYAILSVLAGCAEALATALELAAK